METETKELTLSESIELGITKIAFLSNQINRKTEMCCWFRDEAHIKKIEIKMVESKERYSDGAPVIFEISYNTDNSKYDWYIDNKERLSEIERCVSVLEEVLKERKIPYILFHEVKEYITTSYEI